MGQTQAPDLKKIISAKLCTSIRENLRETFPISLYAQNSFICCFNEHMIYPREKFKNLFNDFRVSVAI
jgi:hypothetical protein